jgi:arylsulfatase A-like enzyme
VCTDGSKWKDVLPDEVVTLAEVLKDGGYATAAFVDGGMLAAEFGYSQGFDVYEDARGGGVDEIDPKAKSWLRDRLGEPFLLFIHTYDVHAPYGDTPEPYRSMFLEGLQRPSDRFIKKMELQLKLRNQSRVDEPSCRVCLPVGTKPYSLTDTQVEYAKALYDGGIRHVDAWFTEFMDFLKEHGIYDEAIIVIISDHGDEFEEHDAVLHDRIYSSVARIPFIIRFPGGRHSREFSETVASIDLMPTLLDAVARTPPPRVQGQSLLPLIRGTGANRQIAVTESPFHGRQIALATANRRLIYTAGTNRTELYGFRSDELELKDLAAADPETVGKLRADVTRWRQEFEPETTGSRKAGVRTRPSNSCAHWDTSTEGIRPAVAERRPVGAPRT